MNLQFNIMDGLEVVRKKDFIGNFVQKYPHVRPKELEKELTAVNRDFGIILYHNKGFLIKWTNLIIEEINFGDYITSFNIDEPASMVTVGGNYVYNSDNHRFNGMPYAIHPNIYRKYTYLNLPTVKSDQIIKICFTTAQQITVRNMVNLGYIHAALQIPKAIFSGNEIDDGLWSVFNLKAKCNICDEATNEYIFKERKKIPQCYKCTKIVGGNPYEDEDEYEDENKDDNF